MASLVFVLGTFALSARQATALDFNYTGALTQTSNFASTIITCGNPVAVANVTGIFKFTPGIAQGTTKQINGTAFSPEVQVGAVGAIPNGTIQVSFHFAPGASNYLDNTKTGYDACTFLTDPGLINPNTLIRSVKDDGSGLQTFDLRCKAAIQDMANSLASEVNRPAVQGPNSLPGVCTDIFDRIREAPPKECMPFYNSGSSKWVLYQMALTQSPSSRTSSLTSACQSTGDDGAKLYNILTLLSSGYSDSVYDIMVSVPVPMITVFMPIVNGADVNKSVISAPWTEVTMVHVNHVNNGSRPKPSWPPAAPVDYSGYDAYVASISRNNATNTTATPSPSPAASSTGIGAGGIAGIVIGVIALLALAAALAFFFIRRRRQRREARIPPDAKELDGSSYGMAEKRMEVTGAGMHEMSPDTYKASELESPAYARHELPTGVTYGHEMDSSRPLVELPGDSPMKEKTPR